MVEKIFYGLAILWFMLAGFVVIGLLARLVSQI